MDESMGVNDSRRQGSRRRAAERLAQVLGTPGGLEAARLLLAQTTTSPDAPAEPSEPSSGPRAISIWQPRAAGGDLVFERPAALPLGDHYAARRTLRAAKETGSRRVVFFGESVAAGYLYAPHLTPAGILATQLGSVRRGFEVVDLARTNETLTNLVATVESSLQLRPDLLVIFAGNNWNLLATPEVSPYVPSVEARQRYARALADGGPAGVARLAARKMKKKAAAALDAVARIAGAAAVPVVAVVPEVNLGDWESRQPAPWLPGDGSARWHRHLRDATGFLARQRWKEAVMAAERMRRLDGGAAGTAFRVIARAEAGRGRLADARWAARAEVDHTSYATLAFLDAPRATGAAQEVLRRAAARHGWSLVDLPSVFAARTELADRRLFLDYCHLTAEGMATAMAAVAAAVVARLEGLDADAGALAAVDLEVPAAVEATARFGAALHGAHRLLTVDGERPVLEHWCRAALDASPGVADVMLDLIAARASPCPAVLTAAQQRNLASPYRLSLQHGWRWDYLDADLMETICRVLEEAGRPARGEVERLFVDRLAVGTRGAELARAPFLWEPLERFYPEVMEFADLDSWGVLRSPWPATSFCLVADGRSAVELDLTARLPRIEGFERGAPGVAAVRVNGRPVGRMRISEDWRRQRLRLKRDALRPGLNRLTVEWPPLPAAGDAALAQAIRRLELGREADVHPVFGEVFSLRAAPASLTSGPSPRE